MVEALDEKTEVEAESQRTKGIKDALFTHSSLLYMFIKYLLHATYLLDV